MQIIAFILALAALVLFLAEYVARGKSWLTLGLAFLTAAWMVEMIVATGSKVTID